jgi:hypothetical protein
MAARTWSNSATSAKPTSCQHRNATPDWIDGAPARATRPSAAAPKPGPVCPGHLALRAALESRARPAHAERWEAQRRPHLERDHHRQPIPNAATRSYASPKAALAWQATPDWVLKASLGRAVRMPTVSELYQGGVNAAGVLINNDPDLKPGTVLDRRADGRAQAGHRLAAPDRLRRAHPRRAVFADQCAGHARTSPTSRTSGASTPRAWSWPMARRCGLRAWT